MMARGFESMATKEDLKTLEGRMNEGFNSIRMELDDKASKEDVRKLEHKVDALHIKFDVLPFFHKTA